MRYVLNPESKETRKDLHVRIDNIEQNREQNFAGTLSGSKCARLQEAIKEPSVGFKYVASLRRDGETLLFKGRVEGNLRLNCDRCLAPVEKNPDETFQLVLRPQNALPKAEEERLLSLEELQIDLYEGDWLDLADLMEEQVLLSVPAKILCDAECHGLCPECGMNWNYKTCHCAVEIADHPFAVLKSPDPPLENPQT